MSWIWRWILDLLSEDGFLEVGWFPNCVAKRVPNRTSGSKYVRHFQLQETARCRIDARILFHKKNGYIFSRLSLKNSTLHAFHAFCWRIFHTFAHSQPVIPIPKVTSFIADSLQRSSAEAKLVAGFRYVLSYIWVCLKIGYTPNEIAI